MGCAPGSHLSRRESSARPNLVNLPGRSTGPWGHVDGCRGPPLREQFTAQSASTECRTAATSPPVLALLDHRWIVSLPGHPYAPLTAAQTLPAPLLADLTAACPALTSRWPEMSAPPRGALAWYRWPGTASVVTGPHSCTAQPSPTRSPPYRAGTRPAVCVPIGAVPTCQALAQF